MGNFIKRLQSRDEHATKDSNFLNRSLLCRRISKYILSVVRTRLIERRRKYFMKDRTYFDIDDLSSIPETIGRFEILGREMPGPDTLHTIILIEFVLIFCAILQNVLQYYSHLTNCD